MPSGKTAARCFPAGTNWIWLGPGHPRNNAHMFARRAFTVAAPARRAVCRITANTAYELFLNGRLVGRGPARSWPKWQYFDTYDLAGFLAPGENTAAVHAYHHGEKHTGALTTCTGPGGLLARFEIKTAAGGALAFGTDRAWRVLRPPQYAVRTGFVTWHRQDYKERFDARREPAGWRDPGFDDRAWERPAVLGAALAPPWENLLPNPLPPLTREPVAPVNVFSHHSGSAYGFCPYDVTDPAALVRDDADTTSVMPLEKGFPVQVLLDFGRPVVGRFHLEIAGAVGGEILVSYGETPDLTRLDRIALRAGAQHYSPFERRFGRYVMLTFRRLPAPVKIRRAWFELVACPVEPRGSFACDDQALGQIWEAARWTLRLNMHDHFEDCPLREQLPYCGDLRVSALLAYHAFGDYKLARETLVKLARLQLPGGRIPGHGPAPYDASRGIPEFPALWLVALRDYWLHSGDERFAARMWPAARRLLDWYAGWEDGRGLMKQLPSDQRSDFVDNLAGIPMDGQVLAVQCFYHLALGAAADLGRALGDSATARVCAGRARRLARAINELFWDETRRGYRDCLSGTGEAKTRLTPDREPDQAFPFSQISNGLALYAGLAPRARRAGALAALLDPGRAAPARSAYMNYYLAEALFRYGRGREALALIRRYWGEMLARGATTFWEVFDPDTPPGRLPERMWSLCHAFAAGPLHSLPRHVLGVAPLAPGFRVTRLAPVPGGLTRAEGRVPTPMGPIEVRWQTTGDRPGFTLDFNQPAGMAMRVAPPFPVKAGGRLELDGRDVRGRRTGNGVLDLPARKKSAAHRLVAGE